VINRPLPRSSRGILEISEQLEAIEGALEIEKAELIASAKPLYFAQHAGQMAVGEGARGSSSSLSNSRSRPTSSPKPLWKFLREPERLWHGLHFFWNSYLYSEILTRWEIE
jgi:hypothetical protein